MTNPDPDITVVATSVTPTVEPVTPVASIAAAQQTTTRENASVSSPAEYAYEREFDSIAFRFRRPSTDQVDRYLTQAPKGVTKASLILARDLIAAPQAEQWRTLTDAKPGFAVQLANYVLRELGYVGNLSD